MSSPPPVIIEKPPNMRPRQALRFAAACIAGLTWLFTTPGIAQIYDSLDAYPPRWDLEGSDCDARVTSHGHLADGGVNAGACENVTFLAGNGSEALLVYPIEPVQPLDDLTATVSVMSAKRGAQIGFRVRYPYLNDPETSRPVSVVVYGASYQSPSEFASIGVGAIERQLRLKSVAVRSEHGSKADLQDAYVDGIVINAYSGAGRSALRIDNLRVNGLIPVGEGIATGNRPREQTVLTMRMRAGDGTSVATPRRLENAFEAGKIIRILQHNGEPLAWVRSLGFDAVLLSKPPDAAILSEAIRSRVLIYAPPPTSPTPEIQALLEPVAAWYIGMGKALDSRQVDEATRTAARLNKWPSRWQRPIIGAPSESWRDYASLLTAIIDDLPHRIRGLGGDEELAQMTQRRRKLGDRIPVAVGIASMPPQPMLRQVAAIAEAIGAPEPQRFHWHSMWLQAMRSLEVTPSAILFRSTRSLTSGALLDEQRAMALSYINRMIAMISPWVVSATPMTPPGLAGANYRCTRLVTNQTDLLIATSIANRGSEVLSGDGATLDLLLTPADAAKTAWRLTHFSAERITPELTSSGARLRIVSPDATEILILSSDPAMGGQASLSSQRFARQAALDRWQLASNLVEQTSSHWQTATATRAVNRQSISNLVGVAQQTLSEAEPMFRSGDIDSTLRMACRADAWAMRSEWQLAEALMPNWPMRTSCPPVDMGAAEIQTIWRPLMEDRGWGRNLMTSGNLDTKDLIGSERWTFGKRLTTRAHSELLHVTRGAYEGPGALRARVTSLADEPLPGGYEGTVVQIQSPSVRVSAGRAIRIDAKVRTLGFGGPHQGLLMYDSIGGQPMGVLIRDQADWTTVRLYRQATEETEIHVMFELIGGGEATIDEVELRVWEPGSIAPQPITRPIADADPTASDRR
ncbi:hypothetical protein N9239_00050 [bacterium]|nr:hypothetical protein [bacterium]